MKFLFAMLFLLSTLTSVYAQVEIIPTPSRYIPGKNYYQLEQELWVAKNDLSSEEFNYFSDKLKLLTGLTLAWTDDIKKRSIHLTPIENPKKDYYEITINTQKIEISYSSLASRFYALNSLLQLFYEIDDHVYLGTDHIEDAPKFDWRGLHLDVARHFFTVDEVKRYIDLMAFYKFNKFHWHLTDDQGWRIEIKKYPKLTEIGGFRDSTLNAHYNTIPRTYSKVRTGGFYTQEQIKDVVAYAKIRSVEVIPEIEMPGHARAALAAYPELSCTGKQQGVEGLWGVFEDIFCSKPSTITFLQDVLAEVIPLFPSEYVHIGGDEAPKMRWKECAHCQQIIEENALKDEHELQSYFIQQMDDFLSSKGKKLIGWDEILEGGLSSNAAVMSWRGEAGGIEAAEQSHAVVMSPNTYCYFDYYQSGDPSEPLAIGGFLPLEKVYEFNPIPTHLNEDKWKYILGGQANLWTEYVSTFDQVEYMVYPRALALIQGLWCEKKPNYDQFLSSFRSVQEPILKKLGVNYARSIYATKISVSPAKQGVELTIRGVDSLSRTKVEIEGLPTSFSKVIGWNDSILLERAKNGVLRTVLVTTAGINDERLQKEQKFYLHNGIGAKVDLITAPHPKYATGGGFTLVDGILGTKPWKGNEWLGFNEKEVELNIGFETLKSIVQLDISFLDAKGSWIYLPKEVDVYWQTQDGKWMLKETVDVTQESMSLTIQETTSRLKFKIRSIEKIPDGAEGAGNLPWIFIDEVQITFDYED